MSGNTSTTGSSSALCKACAREVASEKRGGVRCRPAQMGEAAGPRGRGDAHPLRRRRSSDPRCAANANGQRCRSRKRASVDRLGANGGRFPRQGRARNNLARAVGHQSGTAVSGDPHRIEPELRANLGVRAVRATKPRPVERSSARPERPRSRAKRLLGAGAARDVQPDRARAAGYLRSLTSALVPGAGWGGSPFLLTPPGPGAFTQEKRR